MSFTRDDQLLEPHIIKILEGIRGFRAATIERVKNSNDWESDHLAEIAQVSLSMISHEAKLIKIKNETR